MEVSPAVVVPSLLALKDQGYGEDKGIATLVIAASSIDDILAISGFGVILSTIFSEGDVLQQFLQGPLEVCIGLSFGILWGIVAIYIPHRSESWVVTGRSLMVGLGGLFAVFGSQLAGYSGAGPLASIVMAFVACYGWKKQGWSATNNPVESVFTSMWQIFQPVLFGLIGTAINLSTLEGHAVIYGIATLCVGLSIRLVTSFLNSTVQAAIGPVALDLAEKWHSDEIVLGYASLVLTIAVLSIIITAPLGAIGIYIAGPRLLGKVESEATPEAENEEDSV
ncbi:Sodium hydrogen exchanger 9b2-like protein, mitochondrial [Gryllus bimaculatus]|nr:Sodium hydrogen exchanger 9b2-like protein, mitochondrial [Gryllus bimaculatus]